MTDNTWTIVVLGRGKDQVTKSELRKIDMWRGLSECEFVEGGPAPANQEQLKALYNKLTTNGWATILLDPRARATRHMFELLLDSGIQVLQMNGSLNALVGFDPIWKSGIFETCNEGRANPLPKALRAAE